MKNRKHYNSYTFPRKNNCPCTSSYQFQVNSFNSIKISHKCNLVFTGILLAILLLMSNISRYRLVRGLEDS